MTLNKNLFFLRLLYLSLSILLITNSVKAENTANEAAPETPDFYTLGDYADDSENVLYGHLAIMAPAVGLILGRGTVTERMAATSALQTQGDLLRPSELHNFLEDSRRLSAVTRGQTSAVGVHEVNMEIRSADRRRIAIAVAPTRNSSREELERAYRNLVDEAWRAHTQGLAPAPTEAQFRLQNSSQFAAAIRYLEARFAGRILLFSPFFVSAFGGIRIANPELREELRRRAQEVYCVILPEGAENTTRAATCMPRSVLGQIFNGARYYR